MASLLIAGCAQDSLSIEVISEENVAIAAKQVAMYSLIIDTHIDTPYALNRVPRDVVNGDATLEFDYPRAVEGGLDAAFMSIYVPPRMEDDGTATDFANQLIDEMETIASSAPNKFAIATCAADLPAIKTAGQVALPLGMENGAPIAGDLSFLDHFYNRGIRYITLAHSKNNHISDSSYDDTELWGGLSPFGLELVEVMNQKGIMIDISHLSDKAAWNVLETTKTPVVATHSSLRHFVPGFHRNMSDEMLLALAEVEGVIMINFGSGFVSEEARAWSNDLAKLREDTEQSHPDDEEKMQTVVQTYREENPYPFANVGTVVDHIDRVKDLVGVEHVGIGSDYEGVGPTMPIGLEDVSKFPNLIVELWNRDYSREEVELILGKNFLRVWTEVEQYGATHGNEPICSVANRAI